MRIIKKSKSGVEDFETLTISDYAQRFFSMKEENKPTDHTDKEDKNFSSVVDFFLSCLVVPVMAWGLI